MMDIIYKSITAGLFGFMFANIWQQPGEVFGFIQKFIYLRLINSQKDIIHKYGLFLQKITTCAKCVSVWVFAVLYFAPNQLTAVSFGITFASFIGYKLTKLDR